MIYGCGSKLNQGGLITQVLVHVSTYQGSIWYRFFEPQPYGEIGDFLDSTDSKALHTIWNFEGHTPQTVWPKWERTGREARVGVFNSDAQWISTGKKPPFLAWFTLKGNKKKSGKKGKHPTGRQSQLVGPAGRPEFFSAPSFQGTLFQRRLGNAACREVNVDVLALEGVPAGELARWKLKVW